jgi:hypothetical protein
MIKTIVGSFDSFNEAHKVANDLRAAGFMDSDISIVANNAAGDYQADPRVTAAPDDASATAKGALTGAVVGGGAGLAASLAGLAIPGIGPIIAAGPIVATLAGAGTGAVAGGLIGGLVDLGVPESHAQYYAESVRRGGRRAMAPAHERATGSQTAESGHDRRLRRSALVEDPTLLAPRVARCRGRRVGRDLVRDPCVTPGTASSGALLA